MLFRSSTNELIDICLRYPLLYDVFAFNNTDEGLDKLFSDFNGIRALYKRKDASDNLIKRYIQKIHSFSLLNENRSELEKGDFIVAVDMLELILSRFGSEKHSSTSVFSVIISPSPYSSCIIRCEIIL